MHAVDTNVVVRYLVPADDPEQAERAARIIDGDAVFVPMTVLLETEWILRTHYGFSRTEIADALERFADLPTVQTEDRDRLGRAAEWARNGLDFADALHLASSDHCDAFVTFDKAFIKTSKTVSSIPVRTP